MRYSIIAILDSTEAKGFLLDDNLSVIGQAKGDCPDLKGSVEEQTQKSWIIIDRLLSDLCSPAAIDRSKISRFHFLIEGAGYGPGDFKRQLHKILKSKGLFEKTVVQSPEEAILEAVVGPDPGILVRCDVHSLVLGKGEGSRYELALGWGAQTARWGSSFQIGWRALTQVLHTLIGTNKPSKFEIAILRCCDAGGLQQLRDWFVKNEMNHARVAVLSDVVHEWAEKKGDQGRAARRIIIQEIGPLVKCIYQLQDSLHDEKIKIFIQGRCFQHRHFREKFITTLANDAAREVDVRDAPEPMDASLALLKRHSVWGPMMIPQPIGNIVESRQTALKISEGESLVLGIYGATSRTGAVVGRGNGKALYTIKGVLPLAFQAVRDAQSFQLVFDDIFRRIYTYEPTLMSQVRYIQLCVSGAGAETAQKAYRAAILESMRRYLASVDELTVGIEVDALGVLASELLTPWLKFREQGGITVVSGSGSIIYTTLPNGCIDRQGGYGSPFSYDPGSSYDVGFHLLEWLNETIDIGGWRPLIAKDQILPEPDIDPWILDFLSEVLSYFVRTALPWVGADIEKDLSVPFNKKRDYLRYLPLKCVEDRYRMKSVVAGIHELACSLCMKNDYTPPGDFERIKKEAAGRLAGQFGRLIQRQKDNILRHLRSRAIDQFPVILEGGSFQCPIFLRTVVDGISKAGQEASINFDIRSPRFQPSLGAFALACEMKDARLIKGEEPDDNSERYDPENVIKSGNNSDLNLAVPDLLKRISIDCRSERVGRIN